MLSERDLTLIRRDHELYAERLLKVVDESAELVPLVYRPAQKKVAAAIAAQRDAGLPVRINVGKSRKTGVSTGVQGICLQDLLLTDNRRGLVVAHDKSTAAELFEISSTMYANLPNDPQLKPRLAYVQNSADRKMMWWADKVAINRGEAERGRNSRLNIDTAQEVQGGRGKTVHFLHCSEIAMWQDARKALALLNAVPDVPSTVIICESTAQGFNFWKDHWDRAERGEGRFVNVFISWLEDPMCQAQFVSAEARERFVASIGVASASVPKKVAAEEPYLFEKMGATAEQLHWRRLTISDKANGDVDWFHQEYPACLTAETRVSTDQGIIPIADAGFSVVTESGPIKRWGPQPASRIYKLTTAQGRVIRGTFDHPVQTEDGLVRLADLKLCTEVALRAPRFSEFFHEERWEGPMRSRHGITVAWDLALFIGYYMGDGSWYKNTLAFACDGKDGDVIDQIANLTERFVSRPTRREIRPIRGRRGCVELRAGATAAFEFFKRLGLVAPPPAGGTYRREVCVPECIFRSPGHVVRGFLRGLFEADGSASSNKVRWATSHEQFARDVQLLLLGFGINAPITKAVKSNGSNTYTNWTIDLTVADSRVFHDEIGFMGKRKRALRPKEQPDTGRISRHRPLVDEVATVEPDGWEVTYDFTLDNEEHLFSAAGVLTHNTPEQMFVGSGKHVFPVQLQRSALDAAEHWAPRAEEGVFIASGHETRWMPNGTVEVPTGALWVPRGKTGFDSEHPFWRVWLPREAEESLAAPRDHQYVEVVDPAGTNDTVAGADPDSWAIQVIDHHSLEQVAAWHGRLDPDLITEQAFLAYLFFNEALTGVEVTGGWGNAIVEDLSKRYGHRRLFRRQKLLYAKDQSAESTSQTTLGWQTNRQTKPHLLAGTTELLREETHGMRDRATALQLTTFVWNGEDGKSKTAGADVQAHDDLLMAWMICQQIARLVRPRPKQKPRVSSSVPRNLRH